MAFQFKEGESIPRGLERIVRKEIDKALDRLTGRTEADRDEVVHDARKRFKKIRAVLRLIRPELSPQTYDRENGCFRAAGKPLTAVRDSTVLVTAFDDLTQSFADQASPQKFRKVRQGLEANRDEVHRRLLEERDAFGEVAVRIALARARLDGWKIADDWAPLRCGLKQIYRGGRAALVRALAESSVESLHEWRKQTKYLWHQLQVLQPICPTVLTPLADRLHDLGDYLGDDHDLAVLRQTTEADDAHFGGRAVLDPLFEFIDHRRAELQRKAYLLGRQLYQDRPSVFANRLTPYWRQWRAGKTAAIA
jgi:CHAD domain-containing protein